MAFVQITAYAQSTAATSLNRTITPQRAGNTLISQAAHFTGGTLGIGVPSDDQNNLWSEDVEATDVQTQRLAIGHAHRVKKAATTVTITFASSSFCTMAISEHDNLDNKAAATTNTNQADASSSGNSGAADPVGNCTYVAALTHDGATTALAVTASGWTERGEIEDGSAGQPLNFGVRELSVGSQTCTWSIGASVNWLAAIVAFSELPPAGYYYTPGWPPGRRVWRPTVP